MDTPNPAGAGQPSPEILPASQQPPNYGPVRERAPAPEVQPEKRFTVPSWAALFGVVAILIVGSILFASTRRPRTPVVPTPTPTFTPTPTPVRVLSPFATGSAFLNFETAVAGLSTDIQKAPLQDQTIAPPSLDLPLGFSN